MPNELVGRGRQSAVDHLLSGEWRARKLTPKETFRLQGWPDEYFNRAQLVNSDAQLYKQAGNGVTVNVVRAIAERLKEIEHERNLD